MYDDGTGSTALEDETLGSCFFYPQAAAATFDSTLLAMSPLIYWNGDDASGNIADTSGNNRTGTPFGSALSYHQTSLISEAGSFSIRLNASSVSGWYRTHEAWMDITGDITVGILCKFPSASGNDEALFCNTFDGAGFDSGFLLYSPAASNHITWGGTTSAGLELFNGTVNIRDNVAHWVVGTYQPSTHAMKCYVDNSVDVNGTSSGAGFLTGTNRLTVGSLANQSLFPAIGEYVSRAFILNRLITSNELSTLQGLR